MSTIYQYQPPVPPAGKSSAGYGLKVATILFGVVGWVVWGLSIGFMIGWETDGTDFCTVGGAVKITYGWFISVPTNAAMIYVTARIIFLTTSRSFPGVALLADLHECVARMVAFTVVSLTMWAASLSWLVESDCQRNLVYHLCNYGFVASALVAGLAGGLWTVTSKAPASPQQVRPGVPKFEAPPPQHTHYNQAYVHNPNHYR